MIRFIIICITVVGFLILSIPLLLLEKLAAKINPKKTDLRSLHLVQSVFRLILKITGIELVVLGEENIPKDQAVLYIGNHRSYFDILLGYTHCPDRTGFVAKKEMEKYPLLRDWMRNLHCLFLDRENIREGLKTILTAIDKVKEGISIFIFPEGTRGKGETETDMLPFHEGSFKVATKSGCPIIPVAMTGTSSIFEDHFPKITPTKVILEYGKPILPDELSKEDKKRIGSYTQNIILEMLKNQREMMDQE